MEKRVGSTGRRENGDMRKEKKRGAPYQRTAGLQLRKIGRSEKGVKKGYGKMEGRIRGGQASTFDEP